MKVLVTGACGYKGTILVPKLLNEGHEVLALDTMWFGNFLEEHRFLTVQKASILELEDENFDGVDAIIHLASIANDPCGDLEPKLTWEVSALGTMRLADKAKRCSVKQIIYASSGSVYGLKEEDKVTEDLELLPLTEYNKTKMVAERALMSYEDDLIIQIIRPATVCGYSPRMRLDVAVNMLTMQALTNGIITVFGGDQVRPNIHIDDITDLYIFMLNHPEHTGVYNAGFENLSILDIAKLVANHVETDIEITESNDPRSYRVSSDKLLKTGFVPKKSVEHAIQEIIEKYRLGILKNKDQFYNLNWMEKTGVATK